MDCKLFSTLILTALFTLFVTANGFPNNSNQEINPTEETIMIYVGQSNSLEKEPEIVILESKNVSDLGKTEDGLESMTNPTLSRQKRGVCNMGPWACNAACVVKGFKRGFCKTERVVGKGTIKICNCRRR